MGRAVGNLHLIKLSVGSDSIDSLVDWQTRRSGQRLDGRYYHLTRMWPRREAEVLDGGSIYWVIQGVIQCRQRILDFAAVTGGDGIRRCGIVLDAAIVRVAPTPKRPFQGWRYLRADDAPRDLAPGRASEDALPASLERALAEIGVL